ncbi:hypothetical protein ABFS82_06G134900 [Erythranthe guttata]
MINNCGIMIDWSVSSGVNTPAQNFSSDNEFIFFFGEVATFEFWPEIVEPPEAAALTAAEKFDEFGQRPPASLASPRAFVFVNFLTARRSSHSRTIERSKKLN